MLRLLTSLLLTLTLLINICSAGITFDGVDDKVNLGSSTTYDFLNTTFTACSWYSATTAGYIISRRLVSADAGGWFIRTNSGGTVEIRLIGASGGVASDRVSTSTTAINGSVHHVCGVFTTNTTTAASNDTQLYFDGALDQGSEVETGVVYGAGAFNLYLGSTSDPGDYLTGTIEEVTIYPTGLTAEQINRLYNARLKYFYPQVSLTSYWPLDDCAHNASGEAVTFRDRGPNLQNGTGDDGGNNTGLTCKGSSYLMYPGGVE